MTHHPPVELLEVEAPLEQLDMLLAEATAGQGRLTLIAGEAGIGKTALVQQFCASVRDRADVYIGACDPLSTPTPLGPLMDIAPSLDSELESLLRDSAPRRQVLSALLACLARGTRARVLVLEDVHWADDATLDLLRFLARRLSSTRTLLIATHRDDEVGQRHPLRIALGDVASAPIVRRLSLEPLSLAAFQALTSGSGLDANELHQRAGGNPFFLSQLLVAPTRGVPPAVCEAMASRLARLSAAARQAVEYAAVVGPRVDVALIARIEAVAPSGLDACIEAGLLVVHNEQVAFRHELLREAVLALVSPPRLLALHRFAQLGADREAAVQYVSPRERDVVGLVVQGCTNREIAERLVISERTAENHVQRVLNRLGLRSRTQVAAWAVRHGMGLSPVRAS